MIFTIFDKIIVKKESKTTVLYNSEPLESLDGICVCAPNIYTISTGLLIRGMPIWIPSCAR